MFYYILITLFAFSCSPASKEKAILNTKRTPLPGFDHVPQVLVLKDEDFLGQGEDSRIKAAFEFPETERVSQIIGGRVEVKVLKNGQEILPILKDANARFFDMWLIFSERAAAEFLKAKLPLKPERMIYSFFWGAGTGKNNSNQFKEVSLDSTELKKFTNFLCDSKAQSFKCEKQEAALNSRKLKVFFGALEAKEKSQNDIHGAEASQGASGLTEDSKLNLFPTQNPAAQGYDLAIGIDWAAWIRGQLGTGKKQNWTQDWVPGVGFSSGFLRAEISPHVLRNEKELATELETIMKAWTLKNL